MSSRNSYVDILIPGNSECDSFGGWIIKLKQDYLGGP